MLIVLVRWAIITAARVLATASAALVGLANVLGISTEAKSKPTGSRRKVDRLEKHGYSHEPTHDCEYGLRKSQFLKEAGNAYGYGGKLEDVSMTEFRRLRGRVYVDHAGATLYSERQIRATYQVSIRIIWLTCCQDLTCTLFCPAVLHVLIAVPSWDT